MSGVGPSSTPASPSRRPGLFWFVRAPDWFVPYLLMGLIGLIPVAGSMVQLGWYLEARDNLRRGLWQVPTASFDPIRRGVGPWVALLIYALYALALPAVIGAGLALGAAGGAPRALLALLAVLLAVVVLLGWIVVGFLGAAVVGVADRAGIVEACDPVRIWRAALGSAHASGRVFGAVLLVGILGTVVTLIMGLVIPVLGGLLAGVVVGPASFLAAAPGQADFDER